MNVYLDSSVVLRILLGQPGKLQEWNSIELGVGSALVELECLRTLDRLRQRSGWSDEVLATRRESVFRILASMEVVMIDERILRRAAEPFPTPLGTLDAIHLATATVWNEQRENTLVLATHDVALARAARASGFQAIGIGQA